MIRFVFAVLAFSCVALQPVQAQEPLRIGFLTVRTGPLAAGGRQMEEGINLFLKERSSTLSGRKVEIVFADTAGQPAQAKSKAQELVAFLEGASVLWLLDDKVSLADLYATYLEAFIHSVEV